MRNIMKPAATASSRTRRSVRGVAAVVASLALAAGLGSYPVDAQEAVASATTAGAAESAVAENTVASEAVETSSVAPVKTEGDMFHSEKLEKDNGSGPATPQISQSPISWTREGDVERVVVEDPEGEVWEFGGKASKEDVFAIKRVGEGDIEEIRSVTIDDRVIEPEFYGFVNGEDADYLAFDIQGLHTIPPMRVEFEVVTSGESVYSIADSNDVPTKDELAESGFGQTIGAELNAGIELGVGELRASQPGQFPDLPGVYDQEFSLTSPKADWLDGNPQLQFRVNETGNWRMTRFAIKKNKDNAATKAIDGPVRVRVVRGGNTVVDRTFADIQKREWGWNANGKSEDTEFRLLPKVDDLYLKGGDTVILNPVAPASGFYRVQVWGQNLDSQPQDHTVVVSGDGIPVSEHKTLGNNPYETTFDVKSRSEFTSATVTLSPTANTEDVFFSLPIEKAEGVSIQRKVEKYGDRVVITWYPVKDGKQIDSVIIPADSTVTLRTTYRSAPTRDEEIVLHGKVVEKEATEDPDGSSTTTAPLPIAPPITEDDVPPITKPGEKCTYRDPSKVDTRQPARSLTVAEEEFGFRRFIVASPNSSGSRISSQLYLEIDDEDYDGRFVQMKIGPKTGWVYNALAYNRQDNYLYAISQPRHSTGHGYEDDPCFPAGHLLQINPYTGQIYDLGKVDGFEGQLPEDHNNYDAVANDLGSGINAGTFDSQGRYWVSGSSNWGTGRLYEIDLANVKATSKSSLGDRTPRQTPWRQEHKFRSVSEDFVSIDSAPDYVWGLQSTWAAGQGKIYLERVDLSGKQQGLRLDVTDLLVPDTNQTLGQFLGASNNRYLVFGQAWVEADGSIAFGLGGGSAAGQNEAQIIKLKINDPTKKLSGTKTAKDLGITVVGTGWAPTSYNTDAASAPAPESPSVRVDPKVEKKAIQDQVVDNGDGTYTVDYRVLLKNEDKANSARYRRVVDTPQMPEGVVLERTSWSFIDEFGRERSKSSQNGDGPFILSEGGEIRPRGEKQFDATSNGMHSFNVKMVFSVRPGVVLSAEEECKPYQGLFNTVKVGPNEDTACVPPPESKNEKVSLRLVKISSEDFEGELPKPENRLEGAEFTLEKLGDGEHVVDRKLLDFSEEFGFYRADDLEVGNYRLIETKSPVVDGNVYSLLVKPILFSVTMKDGKAAVVIDQDSEVIAKQVNNESAPSTWGLTSTDAVLTVANVRQGDLPKTGGTGLQLPILLGGALIAAGALVGRRKV